MNTNPATTNRRLAVIALVLGTMTLIAGQAQNGPRLTLDTNRLASMVQQEADTLAVLELAAWIREGRQGYRLVDLRTEQEFSAYHIPGAENIDLTALLDSGFDRNSRVVLCSGDGVLSAQAIVFLWAQGYKRVYTLKGGVAAWQREIVRQPPPAGTALNPSPTRPSPQKEPDQRDGEHFRKEC